MRLMHGLVLLSLIGCGGSDDDNAHHDAADSGVAHGEGGASGASGTGSAGHVAAGTNSTGGGAGHAGTGPSTMADVVELPQVYPSVRANTPTQLIADPKYLAGVQTSFDMLPGDDAGMSGGSGGSAINLAIAIKERLYTAGPTEILRIVQELDNRTKQLDTALSKHACLSAEPSARTVALPGALSFPVMLQCMVHSGGSWLAFGFARASIDADADAGVGESGARGDFYLVEGQEGGMGGAYHVKAGSNDVEAWITVADRRVPNNSQVIMHLVTHTAAGTTELALAGSGVGFCSAHLKTSRDYLFIEAKTNAALPPGAPMTPGSQYCDASRSGCFATSALDVDLGPHASGCMDLSVDSFAIRDALDASHDPEANVTPARVYEYFNMAPTNITAF